VHANPSEQPTETEAFEKYIKNESQLQQKTKPTAKILSDNI
jgi:hypothetical protein